jgi:rhodanese-related sulfurtransferase
MPIATLSTVAENAADPQIALRHYEALLSLETDCSDVRAAQVHGQVDFVLLDVRSPEAYASGHVPGALNLPYANIDERTLAAWAPGTLFVVYCTGPHCNGADRGAVRLARLGRHVKKMLGGIAFWKIEGYPMETGAAS